MKKIINKILSNFEISNKLKNKKELNFDDIYQSFASLQFTVFDVGANMNLGTLSNMCGGLVNQHQLKKNI